jgi:hypothetical protein
MSSLSWWPDIFLIFEENVILPISVLPSWDHRQSSYDVTAFFRSTAQEPVAELLDAKAKTSSLGRPTS